MDPLVERTGGLLMERTRVLLCHAHLPDSFIGEAYRTATHTYNREIGRARGIRYDDFYQRP